MVYLIHFDAPYRHARHYIGFSSSGPTSRGMVKRRLAAHADGRGARLMAAVQAAGIGWSVVRIWGNGDRTFERHLKRQGGHKERICPVCAGKKLRLRAPYWRNDPAASVPQADHLTPVNRPPIKSPP